MIDVNTTIEKITESTLLNKKNLIAVNAVLYQKKYLKNMLKKVTGNSEVYIRIKERFLMRTV